MDATDLHMLKQREELNERLEGELSALNDRVAIDLSVKERRQRKMLRKIKKLAHSLNISMEQSQVIYDISEAKNVRAKALEEDSDDEEMFITPALAETCRLM